jgi:hypothetical protein
MSGFKLKLKGQDLVEKNITDNENVSEKTQVLEMSKSKVRPKNSASQEEKATRPSSKVNLKINDDKSIQQNKKKKSNRYFYKVSNHHELFKIGRSFYMDYMSGIKSFAISSTGYQTSQQKTILGLSSFFDHKDDVKIGIISDNLFEGAFKDVVSLSRKINNERYGHQFPITIYDFFSHFEFIDLNQLLELCNNPHLAEYDEILDFIVGLYDVVLWDVPELHKIKMDSERYFPIIMKYESISIIVAQSLSKQSDIEEIKKFFLGYGINLKGLLLEEKTTFDKSKDKNEGDEKKPWWNIFRGKN